MEDNSEKYKPQYGPTKQKIKLMQGFIFVPRIYAGFYSIQILGMNRNSLMFIFDIGIGKHFNVFWRMY